ncbi:hypothetical protein SUDANB105_07698 [Streptomyces sp. enrichment culture]
MTSDFLKRPEVTAKVTTVDKARVAEEFTRDEHVATTATTNLLRRPDVAFKAMSDDTARLQVNHAQVERSRQARDHFEDTSPVAPAVKKIDRTVEFLDLVTACHSFVAAAGRPAGRTVPGLRDRALSEDEATIVHQNVAKVRATLDWIETAVDTGKVDMDDELTRARPVARTPSPASTTRTAQAAAYLIDSGETAATYRNLLADRTTKLTDLAPDAPPDEQATALAAAWSLSIDHADTLRPVGLARPMLHLTALLHANGISQSVLTSEPARAHLAAHRTTAGPGQRRRPKWWPSRRQRSAAPVPPTSLSAFCEPWTG